MTRMRAETVAGPSSGPPVAPVGEGSWAAIPARLRASGLRWTPQRRLLLAVLEGTSGHVTGAELVERCRAIDPAVIPSTVYRTLDVLEELGVVRHAHGVDGREEFHVFPVTDHGHLYCTNCHGAWEVGPDEAGPLLEAIERTRGFRVQLSHLSIAGLCRECAESSAG
jgi:Fur family transcriptional regulator, ferric uptake regulator